MEAMIRVPEIEFPHIGISINELSPIAFTIFGRDIYWYAITMSLGIICGMLLAQMLCKRDGHNHRMYTFGAAFGTLMGLLCGRAYFVLFAGGFSLQSLGAAFDLRGGGLAIYGTALGAFLAAAIVSKLYKVPVLAFYDNAAMGLLLGQIIGRWGNFFNREAHGGFTDGLFAMRSLPMQTKGLNTELLDNTIIAHGVEYVQYHPTFFYESFLNLVWLCVLIFVIRPRKKFTGELFFWYMVGYGVIRFPLEILRTDQLMFFNTGLYSSQIMSVVFVLVAGAFIVAGRVRASKTNIESENVDK